MNKCSAVPLIGRKSIMQYLHGSGGGGGVVELMVVVTVVLEEAN